MMFTLSVDAFFSCDLEGGVGDNSTKLSGAIETSEFRCLVTNFVDATVQTSLGLGNSNELNETLLTCDYGSRTISPDGRLSLEETVFFFWLALNFLD